MSDTAARLRDRARAHGVAIPAHAEARLVNYFDLLVKWNGKINLTALPLDPPTDETFDRLLVEPLGASKQVPIATPAIWFDLGSGGGSPAIPLKIARPALKLTMIESKERKSAFLREAIRVLGLTESSVETGRFEAAAAKCRFAGAADIVTVRAVKADEELFESAGKLLNNGGRLLMFRPGHSPCADPPGFKRTATYPLIDTPQSFLSVYQRLFHVEQS